MKLYEIINKLEAFAPKELKEEWDNVGLMLGNKDSEIKSAAVCLDVTEDAVLFAIENDCDLIVSHHPFIMAGLKAIDFKTKKGEMIEKLIKNDIAVYSMHTNFDSAEGGVNDALCEILELKNVEACGMIRKGETKETTLNDFINMVKEKLDASYVTCCGDLDKKIKRVAVCGGAGGSFIAECLDCDAFLTGEAKYHEYQMACESDFSLVCAGHFETENVSLYKIRDLIKNMGIEVKDGNIHKSFSKII